MINPGLKVGCLACFVWVGDNVVRFRGRGIMHSCLNICFGRHTVLFSLSARCKSPACANTCGSSFHVLQKVCIFVCNTIGWTVQHEEGGPLIGRAHEIAVAAFDLIESTELQYQLFFSHFSTFGRRDEQSSLLDD